MNLFWLSFVDTARPRGEQFLGACIIALEGGGLAEAVQESWRRGCNPGGAIKAMPILGDLVPHVRPEWIGRLLTREEIFTFEREIAPHLPS